MHFPPEAGAFTVESSSLACDGHILAWESAGDDIDAAAPRLAVELADIGVDRESREVSIVLSLL